MKKTTVKIEGMACGMCEAHVADVIRKNFNVKKVTASHEKKEAVIISEQPLDKTAIKSSIESTGYNVLGVYEEEYVKKGLFNFFKK